MPPVGGEAVSASTVVCGAGIAEAATTVFTGSMATTGETMPDSVAGAGLELSILQQGGVVEPELSSALPSSCICIPAIIGQSGGHCMDSIWPAESGTQNASAAEGANSATRTRLTETTLCQTRITGL